MLFFSFSRFPLLLHFIESRICELLSISPTFNCLWEVMRHKKGQMLHQAWSCQQRHPWLQPDDLNTQSLFWKSYLILTNSSSPASARSDIDHNFHSYHFYGNNVRMFIVTICMVTMYVCLDFTHKPTGDFLNFKKHVA